MKSGTFPTKLDRRDFDFHRTFGATMPPTLPDYFSDAGLWQPNQELSQAFTGLPDIPALPEGCTDYTQTDLCIDEDKVLYDPMRIENITHANANGGGDIRTSLSAAIKVFNKGAYFNITPSGAIDAFDAVRLALFSTQNEHRSASVGTPWFPEFENPQNGILPTPQSFSLVGATWHNWKVCGWKTIGDQVYLIGKSWQGLTYGDKGFCYISRPLFNALMAIPGSAAFTLGDKPDVVQTVNLTWIQTLVSFIRNLFSV